MLREKFYWIFGICLISTLFYNFIILNKPLCLISINLIYKIKQYFGKIIKNKPSEVK